MASRQYSFTVQGFRWDEGTQKDLRSAAIVAASPEQAIDEARALLDPGEALVGEHSRWIVVGANELMPKEAKEWARWHRDADSPHGRTEAVETADAADIATRGRG